MDELKREQENGQAESIEREKVLKEELAATKKKVTKIDT